MTLHLRTITPLLCFFCCLSLCGCGEQMMARQPAPRPLQPSPFFADNMSARPLVQGTVPHDFVRKDKQIKPRPKNKADSSKLAAGIFGNMFANPLGGTVLAASPSPYSNTFPFPITEKVLYLGKKQFEINCVMCHGYSGYGDGMVPTRGFTKPPSYHIPRLRQAPVEHFYNVITQGIGAMPAHDYLVPPEERWAIAAYIRALQLSQDATIADVPESEKQKLLGKGGAAR